MAEATERRKKKRNPDPDGVIASRVLQDIIQNSSDDFRAYLAQATNIDMSGGGAMPMAGGGAGLMPVAGGGNRVVGPMQGPPAPPNYNPPVNFDQVPFQPGMPQVPQYPMPMPGVSMPNVPTAPMPGGPINFEDGSSRMPWEQPLIPNMAPQQLDLVNLLRSIGLM